VLKRKLNSLCFVTIAVMNAGMIQLELMKNFFAATVAKQSMKF